MKKYCFIPFIVVGLASISGCAPVIFGAGVGATTMIAEDRRTSGAMLEDKTIEIKALNLIRDNLGEDTPIKVYSFNRYVLLVGQVKNDDAKIKAEDLAIEIANVRNVQNEIEIAGRVTSLSKNNDKLLKARVLGRFVKEKSIKISHFKIIVESGIVYLMGLVSQEEGEKSSQVAANTKGVKKVITVFEYID